MFGNKAALDYFFSLVSGSPLVPETWRKFDREQRYMFKNLRHLALATKDAWTPPFAYLKNFWVLEDVVEIGNGSGDIRNYFSGTAGFGFMGPTITSTGTMAIAWLPTTTYIPIPIPLLQLNLQFHMANTVVPNFQHAPHIQQQTTPDEQWKTLALARGQVDFKLPEMTALTNKQFGERFPLGRHYLESDMSLLEGDANSWS